MFALFVLFVLSLFFAGLLAENTVYRVRMLWHLVMYSISIVESR